MKKDIVLVGIMVFVVVIAGLVWVITGGKNKTATNSTDSATTVSYSDDNYKYSISYPKEFQAKESFFDAGTMPQDVTYSVLIGDTIYTSETPARENIILSISKLNVSGRKIAIDTDSYAAPSGMKVVKKETVTINGKKAYLYSDDYDGKFYVFANSDYHYEIGISKDATETVKSKFESVAKSIKLN